MDSDLCKIVIIASNKQKETYNDFLRDVKERYNVLSFDEIKLTDKLTYLVLGGDGTLNFLLNSAEFSKNIQEKDVIYFPTGTANDFAKSLRIRVSEPHIMKVDSILKLARKIPVPIMKCNDKRFINVASVGAPAKVTSSGQDLLKKAVGKFSYYIGALEEVINTEKYKLKCDIAGNTAPISFSTRGFVVSQGLYAGGGVKISRNYCPSFGDSFNFTAMEGIVLVDAIKSIVELQKDVTSRDRLSLIEKQLGSLKVKSNIDLPVKLDGEEYFSDELEFTKEKLTLNFYLH